MRKFKIFLKIFLGLMLILIFCSCNKSQNDYKIWMNLYQSGNYEELENQVTYSDDPEAPAFRIIAKLGLKKFDALLTELSKISSDTCFFQYLKEILDYRNKIFSLDFNVDEKPEKVGRNCNLKYKHAVKLLKNYYNNLWNLSIEQQRILLSKAYENLKIISEKLKSDSVTQTDLVKFKRILNQDFDRELSTLDDNDMRKKLYIELMNKIDKMMKVLTTGIDRPQN